MTAHQPVVQASSSLKTPIGIERPPACDAYKCTPFEKERFIADLGGPETVLQRIIQSISNARLIAGGPNHKIYELSLTPHYLLRVPSNARNLAAQAIEALHDPLPDLNFGQPVARAGAIEIVKRVLGYTWGVPRFLRGLNEGWLPAYKKQLSDLNELPNETFTRLAAVMNFLNEIRASIAPPQADHLFMDNGGFRLCRVSFDAATINTADHLVSMLLDVPFCQTHDSMPKDIRELQASALAKIIPCAKAADLPTAEDSPAIGYLLRALKNA